jgi:hypothetical protein
MFKFLDPYLFWIKLTGVTIALAAASYFMYQAGGNAKETKFSKDRLVWAATEKRWEAQKSAAAEEVSRTLIEIQSASNAKVAATEKKYQAASNTYQTKIQDLENAKDAAITLAYSHANPSDGLWLPVETCYTPEPTNSYSAAGTGARGNTSRADASLHCRVSGYAAATLISIATAADKRTSLVNEAVEILGVKK